jgi:ankyrin repeat protein
LVAVLDVDRVCINQGDHKEKGHQVQQMSNIYSRAQRVVIWLGEPTIDMDVFMESMEELDTESIKYSRNSWKISDPAWRDIWPTVQRKLRDSHTDLETQQHDGLESLLWRPWFTRVWILQEVANARAAIIMCGSRSFSARILALAPRLIGVEPDTLCRCQSVLDIMPGRSRQDSWWSQKRDFRTILEKFGTSKASDPRDNIYALLGLSSDACDTDLLRADYAKSLEAVFRDTTAFFLQLPELSQTNYAPSCNMPHFLKHLNVLKYEVILWAQKVKQVHIAITLLSRDGFNMNSHAQNGIAPLLAGLQAQHNSFAQSSFSYDHAERMMNLLSADNGVDWNSKDEGGAVPLLRAIQEGDTISAILLVKRPEILLNVEDMRGRTPLSLAIELQHTELIQSLAARDDLDINFESITRVTPLFSAIKRRNDHIIKLVLSRPEVKVNHQNEDGMTPLLIAVQDRYEKAVELLIQRQDIRVNLQDKYCLITPLLMAVQKGRIREAKLLIRHQDIDVNFQNKDGLTALLSAVQPRETDTEKERRERGLLIGEGKEIGEIMVGILLSHHAINVNLADKDGMTPLLKAIQKRNERMVTQLLGSANFPVNLPDNDGKTPLHVALLMHQDWLVRHLLQRPEIVVTAQDKDGITPLHIAIEMKNKSFIWQLLERREFEIYVLDKRRESRFYIVTGIERGRVVDLMLGKPETMVIGQNKNCKTPVMLAEDEESGKMARLLSGMPGIVGDLETLPKWAKELWLQENAASQLPECERIEVKASPSEGVEVQVVPNDGINVPDFPGEGIKVQTPAREYAKRRSPRRLERLSQCMLM